MHDAICVANWINALPSNTSEDIQHAFKNYKEERYPYALAAYKNSNRMIKGNENVRYLFLNERTKTCSEKETFGPVFSSPIAGTPCHFVCFYYLDYNGHDHPSHSVLHADLALA